MKKLLNFLFLGVILLATGCERTASDQVQSPDKKLTLQVGTTDGKLYYQVSRNDQPVIRPSHLGFHLSDSNLSEGLEISGIRHSSFSESWDQVWGEDRTVDNTYNEMRVEVRQKEGLHRRFDVVFRLFNDGFGFRYEFPEQEHLGDFVIMDELTEFALAGDHQSWSIPYDTEFYEGLYRKMAVSELDTVCTPLTMQTADGLYLSLHEANLTDYAALNVYPDAAEPTRLCTYLTPWSTGEKVFVTTTRVSPWRTMIIAENPGDLLLSRLMLNLNEPCRIEDTSWIQPGRYIGIWWGMHMKDYTWEIGPRHGATTANTKRYMDFAARNGFSGVLVEGWNLGWETWKDFSFTQSYPDFDIEEVTRYGQEVGVKLIGHHETGGGISNYEAQMEDAFAYYHRHGVNAVKTGYVGVS